MSQRIVINLFIEDLENIIDKSIINTKGVYTCDSLKRDFNRVLARQRRTSIYMPRFETSNNEPEERSSNSFSVSVYFDVSKLGTFRSMLI